MKMGENVQIVLDFQTIKKTFLNYDIELTCERNSLNIAIINKNNSIIYESHFNENFLNEKFPNYTANNIRDYISELIDQNQIQITENNNNLKIFLIDKGSFIELILEISFKNLLEKIRICNEKIELMNKEKKKRSLIIILILILIILLDIIFIILYDNIKKIVNKIEKKDIIEIYDSINLLESNIQEKLNNIIYKLELKKIQLTKTNLKLINSINEHSNSVNTIKNFPSGNIIAVDDDNSIIIYNNNFQVIQKIESADESWITYVDIKDENNFVTSSNSTNIITWIKKYNNFVVNQNMKNAHNTMILKVIYDSKGNLISCSSDGIIKIWEERNGKYQNIKILYNNGILTSILLLEDKNILISSGNSTKFWDLNNNYELIKTFNNCYTFWNAGLERIDTDRIIVGIEKKAIIISISNQNIIHEINLNFQCDVLKSIENKGILFIGGVSNDIQIYRSDNYECIQTIKNAHQNEINGITELKDGSIATYANEKIINIWSL